MDVQSFIVSLVGELAWPTFALIALLVLRKSITELLSRVKQASWKGGEVNFDNAVSDLADSVGAIDQSTVENDSAMEGGGERSKTGLDSPYRSVRLLATAKELANEYPMAAIAVGRSSLEASLAEEIEGVHESYHRRSLASLIRELEGLLGDSWVKAAKQAIRLGNEAVHGHAEHVTSSTAKEYLNSIEQLSGYAEVVLEKAREATEEPKPRGDSVSLKPQTHHRDPLH
ncbi:MAG: hypothetical protein ACTH92_07770 [Corynebacterium variabile]|uniref:hypothetical protein n=1 Tax=Corynebacterium variabile TaxID=1727 RepID=UPI003F9220AE